MIEWIVLVVTLNLLSPPDWNEQHPDTKWIAEVRSVEMISEWPTEEKCDQEVLRIKGRQKLPDNVNIGCGRHERVPVGQEIIHPQQLRLAYHLPLVLRKPLLRHEQLEQRKDG
jgi:hypothetical protein